MRDWGLSPDQGELRFHVERIHILLSRLEPVVPRQPIVDYLRAIETDRASLSERQKLAERAVDELLEIRDRVYRKDWCILFRDHEHIPDPNV